MLAPTKSPHIVHSPHDGLCDLTDVLDRQELCNPMQVNDFGVRGINLVNNPSTHLTKRVQNWIVSRPMAILMFPP